MATKTQENGSAPLIVRKSLRLQIGTTFQNRLITPRVSFQRRSLVETPPLVIGPNGSPKLFLTISEVRQCKGH